MRLLSCHIENFGKISNFSFDFTQGINAVCEENGWGKSTFAAFLRAMFYGLAGDRKRSLENERTRFKPWQGGAFGGKLVFEADGKEYQITRIFGNKEADDVFELRDARTNLPSTDYSANIGEELFRINRESFVRTLFIGQNDVATNSTDDVNAKIGNLTDDTNDINNFDSAMTKLAAHMSRLNPKRATGSISKRRDEIAQCERIARDGMGIEESIRAHQANLDEVEEAYRTKEAEIGRLVQKIEKAAKQEGALARKEEWERLKATVFAAKQKAGEKKTVFPGAVPSEAALNEAQEVVSEIGKIQARMSSYQMSHEETAEYSVLKTVFGDGVPTEEELKEKQAEAEKYEDLCRIFEAMQPTEEEKNQYKELERAFLTDTGSVNEMIETWQQREIKLSSMASDEAYLQALETAKNTANSNGGINLGALILLVFGIVILVAGAAVTLIQITIGTIAAAVGLALAIVGVVGMKKKKTNGAVTEADVSTEALRKTIEDNHSFVVNAEALVAVYLRNHNRDYQPEYVAGALQEISAESIMYANLADKMARAGDAERIRTLQAKKKALQDFIERFPMPDGHTGDQIENLEQSLFALREMRTRFIDLQEQWQKYEKAKRELQEKTVEVDSFLSKYGYQRERDLSVQLNGISECLEEYEDALMLLKTAQEQLKAFEEKYDVSVFAKEQWEEMESLEELNEQLRAAKESSTDYREKKSELQRTLSGLKEAFDRWEENRENLEELKRMQSMEEAQYKYVEKAAQFMNQAKESMTSRYTAPLMESFLKYYRTITEEDRNRFYMDANVKLTVEEQGLQREIETLSCGYRDLINICLRIALIDAMYQEETPIIILDDPFTNLDDAKMKLAGRLLEEISLKYQVLYFTCSEARK